MAKKDKYLVKFFKGTSQQYNSITPDAYTFYFVTDLSKIYLGDVQLSNTQLLERIDFLNQQLQGKATIIAKTKEEWSQQTSLISQNNTFYIYTDRTIEDGKSYPGIKVGDGTSYVVDLPFVDDLFYSHINNLDIHVTLAEKEFWNNKVRVQDSEIDKQNLIFTIH